MRGIHGFMLGACALFVGVSAIGLIMRPASGWQAAGAASAALLPVSALPAIIWNDRRKLNERDAALTLPWIVLLIVLIPHVVGLLAQLDLPLRDGLFIKVDHALGFSVPAIAAWTSRHPHLNILLDRSYSSLAWLIAVAILVPSLTGKKKAAEQFLLANTIAFLTALPVFALLPAIGPWAGYHFPGNADQTACEASIIALRDGAQGGIGIVCFPSFHVIWAVICAAALWTIKPLRVPAALFAALVVISTITTGWHYVVDVLAGLLFAGGSILCANVLLKRS